MKKSLVTLSSGFAIGVLNGLLGAGGGMIAVPILKKMGLDQKKAHENAVAVILPLSILSGALYIFKGYVTIGDAFAYIPTGLIGAVLGTIFMKKISSHWLKRIFGGFMVYAGVRLLLK